MYEILFGILMMVFIFPLLSLLGLKVENIELPIFHQTAGLLAIILGSILLFSSFNVEKYLLNLILIIYLRFAIQLILILNMFLIPQIALGLLFFGLIDLVFALITIYLIKHNNLSMNLLKIIK
ncbi:MAG: membrane protein of unknown function [Promethearchaeota archaeon]|nr:MAG: membrane protein of unknown function [Candidatus Lokiarchaeota archaeon]